MKGRAMIGLNIAMPIPERCVDCALYNVRTKCCHILHQWCVGIEKLPNCPLVEDVEPVRHAIWVQKEYWKPLAWDSSPLDWDNYDEKTHSEKDFCWHCSDCDYERSRDVEPKDRYCPNCGAKMDFEEIITNDRFKEEGN